MRMVRSTDELGEAIASAQREATASFGDGTVFVERYVEGGRHVEIQVFADHHGNVVSLFERDCSLQRRHQKLIEETPSTAVGPELRARMGEAALRGRPLGRLRGCGHGRVPARSRRHVRVPRDEHPPAGGAPGDRVDHRPRPRRAAARGGGGRGAAGGCAAPDCDRARDRGPAVRRGPGERLPPELGHVPPRPLGRRGRGALRQRHRRRIGRQPVLRLDGREGDRLTVPPERSLSGGCSERCARASWSGRSPIASCCSSCSSDLRQRRRPGRHRVRGARPSVPVVDAARCGRRRGGARRRSRPPRCGTNARRHARGLPDQPCGAAGAIGRRTHRPLPLRARRRGHDGRRRRPWGGRRGRWRSSRSTRR